MVGSSVVVVYMGYEGRFGDGVEAGYSNMMDPWVQTKLLNQSLLHPLSSSFQLLPQFHFEWLGWLP